MAQIRKYLVAGGTFSVAMGIGFVMQNGDALASRMVADEPVMTPMAQPIAEETAAAETVAPAPEMPAPAVSAALAIPSDLVAPAPAPAPVELAAAELDSPLADAPLTDAGPQAPLALDTCVADMEATVGPAATVMLEISAPCAADSVATIHHQGMIFSVLIDSAGKATVMAPALAANAVFIADLPGGYGAAAVVSVPEIEGFDRAVLQWQGVTGLGLHALEFGAGYNQDGHVWAASARGIDAVESGSGGFLMRLGDVGIETAFQAEVYTFPSGTAQRDGRIELSVEAEVLPGNCGRAIAAQSIQIAPGSLPAALDLTMTMPGCDAVGEFLVLKNMLESLTLASR